MRGSPVHLRRWAAITGAVLLVAALAAPASATVYAVYLPPGQACADFGLGITSDPGVGGGQHTKEFRDRDGNVVKFLSAGTGSALTFWNATSGASLPLRSNGAVSITKPGPGGLQIVANMGHNVVIMFPTDVPPGPSTTLYVGRVTYTVDALGTFTIQSWAGSRVDICAALD